MRTRVAGAIAFAAVLLGGFAPTVAASDPSCTAQFTSTVAPQAVPFGQTTVVPEVRDLTLGGPNLGQEVKALFATADKAACPVG